MRLKVFWRRPQVNFVLYVARRLLETTSCDKLKHQRTSIIFIHRPLKRNGLETQMNSETRKKRKKTTLKPSQAQPRFQSKSEQVFKTTGKGTSQNDSQFSRKFTRVFVSTGEMRPRNVIFSGNVSLLLCPFVMLIIFCMIVKNTYRCPIVMLITILVVAQ